MVSRLSCFSLELDPWTYLLIFIFFFDEFLIQTATSSGNTTSTSTSTLANFPTATVPTTGSLAGTAVAPGPLATGSGTASGPDDSYIAAAVSRYGGGARGLVSLVLGAATLLLAGYLVL